MPYQPSVSDQRAQINMQGLQMGQQNALQLGQWLTNFLDQQKQLSAAGKSADYFVQAAQSGDENPVLNSLGLHPEEWRNLGAREKASAVQGFTQAQAQQRLVQETAARVQEQQARAQWMQEQVQALGQKREDEAAMAEGLPRLMEALGRTGDAAQGGEAYDPETNTGTNFGTGQGAKVSAPQRVAQAIAEAGKLNPKVQSALVRQLLPSLLPQAIDGRESAAQTQEREARAKYLQEQATALGQKREEEGAMAEGLPRLMEALGRSGDAGSPMPQRMVQAIAEAGKLNPRVQSALARQFLPTLLQGNEDEGKMNFTEDPVSGFRFATKGKIVQPSGVNPEKAGPQILPQHDEDGNLIGYSQVDGKGRATFYPAKGGAKLKQAVDGDSGQPLSGLYVDESGKVHDTRSALEKLTGEKPKGQAGKVATPTAGTERATVRDAKGNVFTVPRAQLPAALGRGFTQVE